MLYYEDSPIEYYPTVKYWYRIYYDSILHKEIIKEIRTKVGNTSSDFNVINFNILSTNQKRKSLFLLATNIKINEKLIGMYTEIRKNSDKCKNSLNPGNKEWLYFETKNNTVSSECYYLIATGNYKMSEYGAILEDYKIFVADAEPPNSKFISNLELTMHFGVKESFELEYCGDIDGDSKPDIIIRSCSTQGCNCVLFLSSEADSNELLGKASVYAYFSDY
jgi:hypothetical protein